MDDKNDPGFDFMRRFMRMMNTAKVELEKEIVPQQEGITVFAARFEPHSLSNVAVAKLTTTQPFQNVKVRKSEDGSIRIIFKGDARYSNKYWSLFMISILGVKPTLFVRQG